MTRQRFSWTSLPPTLLRALQRELSLEGDPAEALRRRYGARPSPEFVGATWPLLRERWLRRDRTARASVVERLRTRRLGNLDIPVGNATGQMDYLRSCRSGTTLRNVVAEALLAAGHAPTPDGHPTAPSLPALQAEAPLAATAIVEQLLAMFRRVSGAEAIELDPDGDIPLRYGSTMVFVRVFAEPPIVRVFSPLLTDVGLGLDLLETVNRLNDEYFFVKFSVSDGAVVAAMDLFARPLVEQHVLEACGVIGETADQVDEQLQDAFGGRTFFSEYKEAKPAPGTGGYL